MATENRSLRFMGTAFGTNVTLNIELNGNTIYNGIVPSVDDSIAEVHLNPDYPNTMLAEAVNIADIHTGFEGSLPMKITVAGGNGVLLRNILSNYQWGNSAGLSTGFDRSYWGIIPNSDGSPDVRSNVAIDGVAQVYASKGVWEWIVPAGSNITCDFNISRGKVGNISVAPDYLTLQ